MSRASSLGRSCPLIAAMRVARSSRRPSEPGGLVSRSWRASAAAPAAAVSGEPIAATVRAIATASGERSDMAMLSAGEANLG